jgi:hypothetical protein
MVIGKTDTPVVICLFSGFPPDLGSVARQLASVCCAITQIPQQTGRRSCALRRMVALLLTSAAMAVQAQTAGTTTLGVSVTELNNVINGWSVREQLLGQSVYNDKGEKIGKIEDIILTKDRLGSYGM